MRHFILADFLTNLDNKLSTYSIKLSDEKNVNQDVLNLMSIFKKLLINMYLCDQCSEKKRD